MDLGWLIMVFLFLGFFIFYVIFWIFVDLFGIFYFFKIWFLYRKNSRGWRIVEFYEVFYGVECEIGGCEEGFRIVYNDEVLIMWLCRGISLLVEVEVLL